MHDMGLDAYRFSIAWPRLIPGASAKRYTQGTGPFFLFIIIITYYRFEGSTLLLFYDLHGIVFGCLMGVVDGRGAVNPKGLEYYNNLIDELLRYGHLISYFVRSSI